MTRNKPYRLRNFVLDAVMVFLTSGFWLIWVVVREMQNFR